MSNTNTATVLGISEEVTTCDCCGRSHLKRTVALSFAGGPTKYYGCDCASKALRSPTIRNFNAAAVRELGEWARRAAKYGTDAVTARYGFRNLEMEVV